MCERSNCSVSPYKTTKNSFEISKHPVTDVQDSEEAINLHDQRSPIDLSLETDVTLYRTKYLINR